MIEWGKKVYQSHSFQETTHGGKGKISEIYVELTHINKIC